MKYKAYLIQRGNGCDYTIGCAQTVINIDATNMEEARTKLTSIILNNYNHEECMLENVELYEINEIFIMPICEIYQNKNELNQKIKEKEIEETERKEFERLKEKYGRG